MKQKLSLGDDTLQSIEENHKTEDSDDDIPVYERRSSNQSTASTSSVDSKTSEKSSESSPALKDSEDSSKSSENLTETDPEADGVKELTENLKCLKVEEKKLSEFDKIKSEVKETKEGDVEERAPDRRQHSHHSLDPYYLNAHAHRSTDLMNGGTIELSVSNTLPVIPNEVLEAYLLPCEPPRFTVRQPSPISTPNSTPNPYPNVLSPSSGYGSGFESRSPIYVNDDLVPTTIRHSSDEEERRKIAINEVRTWMDSSPRMKDVKMHEWIQASSKDTLEELFTELTHLITRSRFTDRKFVKIYAIIAQILNREGDLKHFFLEGPNILSSVVRKNNPLFLRYIIETIFNLGINPENLREPVKDIWDVIINSRNELNQPVDMSDMLNTMLSLKHRNNTPMFSLNAVDARGFTPLHRILSEMSTHHLATKYVKICLDHQPNLMLTTLLDNRTYMHHALIWGVPPQILDDILDYCARNYSSYNILQELDVDNETPEDLANNVLINREEILAIFERYTAVPVHFDLSTFLNNFGGHPLPDEQIS